MLNPEGPVGASRVTPAFVPFHSRWDLPQLRKSECLNRSSFEWWYFDVETPDHTALVVVLSRRNPVLSSSKPSIYLAYKDSSRTKRYVQNYDPAAFQTNHSPVREIRLAHHAVRMAAGDAAQRLYRVTVRVPWLEAELEVRPTSGGFLPSPNGCYFRGRADPTQRTCVSFSAPVTEVTGSIRVFNGPPRTIVGMGYHDHPWGTEQLFWTHQEWHWGRMANSRKGVMFADVRSATEFKGRLRFLYTATSPGSGPTITDEVGVTASDWRKESLFGMSFPHALMITSPAGSIRTAHQKTLSDLPIYNRSVVIGDLGHGEPAAKGWTEYYRVRTRLRRLIFIGARLVTLFWRPFPYIGQ